MNEYNELGKLFTRNSLSKLVFKKDDEAYRACAASFISEGTLKVSRNYQVFAMLYDILTDFSYYTKHLESLENLDIVKFQKLMEEQLRNRKIKYPDKYKLLVPAQIKYLVYFLNPSKKQYVELDEFLYSMYDENAQDKLNIS